ncbi:MAG: TIGR02757 family protein [Chitinophagales bacterium]
MKRQRIFDFLEENYRRFHRADFISNDPISIPHRFKIKQDIEISAFFAATLSWGNRKTILQSTNRMMHLMDEAPYDFVMHHTDADLKKILPFVHRTFNATDALYFIAFFHDYYAAHHSLEEAFLPTAGHWPGEQPWMEQAIAQFHEVFFALEEAPQRTRKHVATPLRGSTCKRLNMFLRWMVRPADGGVDFGLWKNIQTAHLLMPLDVHVDRVARSLGLLQRPSSDWKTVLELTEALRTFDANDPVKYDYALFGVGVNAVI